MAQMYYDSDANPSIISGTRVAIIGYGSQGHAHALNLSDSGVKVKVALRPGSASGEKAWASGLEVLSVPEAVAWADLIMFLAPDTVQKEIYDQEVAPHLRPGQTLGFAHGFNIRFGEIVPPKEVGVIMIAPKGPGHLVRRTYEEGGGVPSLIAVAQDPEQTGHALALSYAWGIGSTKAGVLDTTFAEETETDLFGEQVVLCGGLSELIVAGFTTLVEAGYQPESAYFECLHEMKLIVDLLYEHGLAGMWFSVSETAEYGGLTRGPRVINEATREEMRRILGEIQDGTFARELIDEMAAGRPNFNRLRQEVKDQPVEQVGTTLRAMMPFLSRKSKLTEVSGG